MRRKPTVLVACEFSGIVRDAFLKKGCKALSCDLLPTEREGPHYRGDVRDILDTDWDLMIAHPPCTYLCVSGAAWFKDEGRKEKQDEALAFVKLLLDCPIPRICLENPIGVISTRLRQCSQIVQPHHFGHKERKTTCLWLKNLTLLQPVNRIIRKDGQEWVNVTPSGQSNIGPSKDRWKQRSRTYKGVAQAMADQWYPLLRDYPL